MSLGFVLSMYEQARMTTCQQTAECLKKEKNKKHRVQFNPERVTVITSTVSMSTLHKVKP